MCATLRGTFSTASEFLRMRREHWMEPERIRALQARRFREILREAVRTPGYAAAVPGAEDAAASADAAPQDIATLPKTPVRANPGAFISPAHAEARLSGLHTSGYSGAPMKVFVDGAAFSHRHAIGLLQAQDFRRHPADLLVEVTRNPYPYAPFGVPGLFRKRHLSIYADVHGIFDGIRRLRPDIIGWYPSMAYQLARVNDAQGRPVRLKSVFSGGETLLPRAREAISQSFGCSVFNQYSSVEFSSMAWECPEEHSLHVNESSFLLEVIDDAGKPNKSGEGEVAVTCFFNHAMPLVRYLIGDRAAWGRECPCGRGTRVLESVCGRSNDCVVLPSGRLSNSFAFNLLHYGGPIEGVWEYQFVQEREGELLFRYVPRGGGMSQEGMAELKRRIARACLGEDMRLEIEAVQSIPREKSGKFRDVVSRVAQPSIRQ
jgi:phenylacetate-CoA ligase